MTEDVSFADLAAACDGELRLPPRGEEQVFAAPWQAQVFAMTVALHERGLFTWPQWAAALSERLAASEFDDGRDYYLCWAEALIGVLDSTGTVSRAELDALEQAWHDAASRTPHGRPITL